MKTNQKKESGSKVDMKKENPLVPKSPATGNDKSKNEGEEYVGEGHRHDYSVPIAGEDGGTEDPQTGNKSKKPSKSSDKNQHSEQGKTPGEQPGI